MSFKRLLKGKAFLYLALGLLALAGALAAMQGTQTTAMSREEKRIAQVLEAMAGVGRVEVALFYAPESSGYGVSGAAGAPTGAVVVAQGAEELAVRLDLIRAVRTLLSLPQQAVDVFVMEEDR